LVLPFSALGILWPQLSSARRVLIWQHLISDPALKNGRPVSAAPSHFPGHYLFYEAHLLIILLIFLWDWKNNR